MLFQSLLILYFIITITSIIYVYFTWHENGIRPTSTISTIVEIQYIVFNILCNIIIIISSLFQCWELAIHHVVYLTFCHHFIRSSASCIHFVSVSTWYIQRIEYLRWDLCPSTFPEQSHDLFQIVIPLTYYICKEMQNIAFQRIMHSFIFRRRYLSILLLYAHIWK